MPVAEPPLDRQRFVEPLACELRVTATGSGKTGHAEQLADQPFGALGAEAGQPLTRDCVGGVEVALAHGDLCHGVGGTDLEETAGVQTPRLLVVAASLGEIA